MPLSGEVPNAVEVKNDGHANANQNFFCTHTHTHILNLK